MRFPLASVEFDTSIQCRASIDTATVNEYAERMTAGDEFPEVVLFGDKKRAWIGDGWHRIMAARQIGARDIAATMRPGVRADALKHALGANAVHGHRRTNADKRRCVEIALSEFPKLSSRGIAKLCGVSPDLVDRARRDQLPETGSSPERRVSLDGKTRPATVEREPAPPVKLTVSTWGDQPDDIVTDNEAPEPEPRGPHPDVLPKDQQRPRNGMQFARLAIRHLECITDNDAERDEAFSAVRRWIDGQS